MNTSEIHQSDGEFDFPLEYYLAVESRVMGLIAQMRGRVERIFRVAEEPLSRYPLFFWGLFIFPGGVLLILLIMTAGKPLFSLMLARYQINSMCHESLGVYALELLDEYHGQISVFLYAHLLIPLLELESEEAKK